MPIGLVGKKCGMTRVFSESGESMPVTVIEATPNRVVQVKTIDNDGYRALQVAAGSVVAARVNKPSAGHFAKANVEAGKGICEFRLLDAEMPEAKAGDQLTVEVFKVGQMVDVRGVTRGKGFAGTIKRHNFQSQDATHGNSISHRKPGSIGQNQSPGRVFPGKRMSGHMGDVNRTAQNQEIIKVDVERNLLLVRGAVPGAPGGEVIVTPSTKVKGGE
jgi:large subunit ribosomal protein L3